MQGSQRVEITQKLWDLFKRHEALFHTGTILTRATDPEHITIYDIERELNIGYEDAKDLVIEFIGNKLLRLDHDFLGKPSFLHIASTEKLKKMAEKIAVDPEAGLSEVSFDPATGNGSTDGKPFNLAYGKIRYTLFSACFFEIGEPIERSRVLLLIGVNKPGDNEEVKRTKSEEARAINGVVSKLRRKTWLNRHQLCQSGGSVTLKVRKTQH